MTLKRAIRDLERERMALERQEKQMVIDIKKTAKQNQMVRKIQVPLSQLRSQYRVRSELWRKTWFA